VKLTIEQSDQYATTEIFIKCGQIDLTLEKIIKEIRLYGFSIIGKRNGETHSIKIENIFYFESIDEKTYIYCEKEVYECAQRLWEIEEQLKHINFQRISKNCIINIYKLVSVRPIINYRLEATLENGEKVIVNRNYVMLLKQKLNEQE